MKLLAYRYKLNIKRAYSPQSDHNIRAWKEVLLRLYMYPDKPFWPVLTSALVGAVPKSHPSTATGFIRYLEREGHILRVGARRYVD